MSVFSFALLFFSFLVFYYLNFSLTLDLPDIFFLTTFLTTLTTFLTTFLTTIDRLLPSSTIEDTNMDIIPSRKKSCPFCGAEEPPAWLLWNSGNWLEYHLLDYIGCDRIPADGIHDVLKIRSLPIMSSILRHLHPGEQIPGEKPCFYQCPFCPARRDTIGWFIGHVQREPHYNGSSMAVLLKACTVPKWQPKGPFNFLGLPAGK